MVEFALVVPVFLALVMGMIDFGATFNDYNSVRQGVREGARQIVVADVDMPECSAQSAAWEKAACVTKERIGLDPNSTRVKLELAGTYEPGEQVTVCTMYQTRSVTRFYSSLLDSQVLTSKITMRIEQIDDTAPVVGTSYAETPLPGQNWAWC